jgi:hypothetical protein
MKVMREYGYFILSEADIKFKHVGAGFDTGSHGF